MATNGEGLMPDDGAAGPGAAAPAALTLQAIDPDGEKPRPATELHLSSRGAALIKHFESCMQRTAAGRFVPYVCPAGVLTIGWGHTNDNGRRFDASAVWTQAECDAAFDEDMAAFEKAVRAKVTASLRQHHFDALVSFAYNCGQGNLSSSTLLRKLNSNDFEGAALEFPKWNRGGGKVLAGLVRRRAAEALLFQGIGDVNFDGTPDQPSGSTTEGHHSAIES